VTNPSGNPRRSSIPITIERTYDILVAPISQNFSRLGSYSQQIT
jgi:hypothetical protein